MARVPPRGSGADDLEHPRVRELEAEVARLAALLAHSQRLADLGGVERAALLSSIIENIPDMVFVKEAGELRFELFNRAGEELLGHPRTALLGRNDHDIFPPEQAEFFVAKDRQTLSGGVLVDIPEEPIVTSDGTTRYLHTKKVPIMDAAGKPAYLLGISQDVTAIRQARADIARYVTELESANAELARSDRYKDEFLGIISHELRTPLNFILGFASILDDELQGALNPDQRGSLAKILEGAQRMQDLVCNMLDVARIQAGKVALASVPTPFPPLVEEAVGSRLEDAAAKDITLVSRISGSAPAMIEGPRIMQVLANLIDNALKFTPRGGRIEVTADVVDGRWHTRIKDTGIGIAPADATRLFTRFLQLDMTHTRQAAGVGLGLAIAKGLVDAHGGTIGVDSQPDVGSTFWFTVPLAP